MGLKTKVGNSPTPGDGRKARRVEQRIHFSMLKGQITGVFIHPAGRELGNIRREDNLATVCFYDFGTDRDHESSTHGFLCRWCSMGYLVSIYTGVFSSLLAIFFSGLWWEHGVEGRGATPVREGQPLVKTST